MARLNNGNGLYGQDYGPGGDVNRPIINRFISIYNATGADMFIPDNSAAERVSVYNYVGNVPGVTAKKGRYWASPYLYQSTAIMGIPGGSPCWSPRTPGAIYRTPAGCPSGFNDIGVTNQQNVNPNTYRYDGTVRHGTLAWEFYQVLAYGCPTPFVANISVRRCIG